ncbi:ATP-binding protein [uncultured Streptomyces sp.]|uniref:ATP-binding protein n=1 Tax=uncultured Streptomyces sp. TaxID=174707 RepID=UPI002607F504|nr:ATP-binding protein [uncultured Streptomyces sp.]
MRPSLRSSAPALLISAALTGLACVAAVVAAPEGVRTPLAWGAGCAAVLLTAAVTVSVHSLHTARALRAARAEESRRFTAETTRLVSASAAEAQRFTAETARVKASARAETERIATAAAAAKERMAAEAAAERRRLTEEAERVTAEAAAEREKLVAEAARALARARRSESERAAAVAACANAAGRMQALSTSMLADLREMENRHNDDTVLGDLLHLDHRTAQAGRLADSIAVLTGARSGRRWAKPIVMESILRGAMGRIGGYQRIRLHSVSDVAVAGHAAEGVMHALAELLDNAANFSPPTAEVHVYVEEVPAGTVITIEDSGLIMGDVQLRRAERAVSAENQDLTGLSGTRLGLAVVGRLARKHGLTVSFRPSARGGTGVLMMLPQEIITRTSAPAPAAAAPAVRTDDAVPAASPARTAAPVAEPEPAHGAAAESGADAPGRDREAPAAPEALPTRAKATAEDTQDAESTGSFPLLGDSGLPQRRRGRTLAAAESRAAAADGGGSGTGAPRRATDPKVQAARFSTFSKAVRATPPHPEGNTR